MIGLDIGTYSIKAVELKKKDNLLALTGFKMAERLQGEPLPASLKKVLEGAGFGSEELNICLPGNIASVRVIEMPEMSSEELKKAVRFEVERFIPFSIEGAIIDYQIIAKNPTAKKNTVLFAAAREDFVKNFVDVISQIGFKVKSVDVSAVALTNAFLNTRPSGEKDEESAFLVLHVGDSASNISIIHKGVPMVLRDIAIAGREVSEAITKSLDIDIKEAYQVKHNPPDDKKDSVGEAIKVVLNKLSKELRLSIGYFENQYSKGVSSIYLSGGSARLLGLKESLAESLDCRVEPWNPFGSIAAGESVSVKSLDDAKDQLAVAVGLAIKDD
jgi:type IV pilus assembly protein PilM